MNVRPAIVRTLFRAEIRMVFRDRRVILTAIVFPLVLMPLIFLGSHWALKKRERTLNEQVVQYAVTGTNANVVREWILLARNAARARTNDSSFRFEEKHVANPLAALGRNEIQLVLAGDDDGTNASPTLPGKKLSLRKKNRPFAEMAQPGAPSVRIVFRADRDVSAVALGRMQDALRQARAARRDELLRTNGFTESARKLATVSEVDVASKKQLAGLWIGRTLTLLVLFCMLTGGAVVATDSVAGEKERGTLETLLTSSARRIEIVAGKLLVVMAVALTIALVQVGNLLLYAGFKLLPVPSGLADAVSPMVAMLLALLFLPVVALISAVLLLLSGRARSYKEAQMFLFPVLLIALIPAAVPLVPGFELRSAMVLVPLANIALGAREVLSGSFDWPMLAMAWLITSGAAAWTVRMTVQTLSAERLVTATDRDLVDVAGGPALYRRHVGRWFVMLWAVLLLVSNYLGKTDLRGQILINLVVLFFSASCLMLWRYQLNVREVLSLRPPKPAVWLGVLFAVPGGILTASGLFRLVSEFLPVSSQVMEQFDESIISPNISLAQLLFFVAVMPGVFEEILFRGLLQYGLKKRFRPLTLTLVVGLVFGIFHGTLFRVAPTAALGVMLSAVTVLSGSIFPAMLWHALSNGLSIVLQKMDIPLTELDWITYLYGAAMLGVAFWIFGRNRHSSPLREHTHLQQ